MPNPDIARAEVAARFPKRRTPWLTAGCLFSNTLLMLKKESVKWKNHF
jgi:hypothetical protein